MLRLQQEFTIGNETVFPDGNIFFLFVIIFQPHQFGAHYACHGYG